MGCHRISDQHALRVFRFAWSSLSRRRACRRFCGLSACVGECCGRFRPSAGRHAGSVWNADRGRWRWRRSRRRDSPSRRGGRSQRRESSAACAQDGPFHLALAGHRWGFRRLRKSRGRCYGRRRPDCYRSGYRSGHRSGRGLSHRCDGRRHHHRALEARGFGLLAQIVAARNALGGLLGYSFSAIRTERHRCAIPYFPAVVGDRNASEMIREEPSTFGRDCLADPRRAVVVRPIVSPSLTCANATPSVRPHPFQCGRRRATATAPDL